ncbi:MAG: cysteine protease [Piccolia ochrophora]|nr:MAG: cysteine protease [Piccolia ochrophora]
MTSVSDRQMETYESQAQTAEGRLLRATSKAEALEAAITAADFYMQALHSANTADKRRPLQRKCSALLDQAERIKERSHWPLVPLDSTPSPELATFTSPSSGSTRSTSRRSAPLSNRPLPAKERRILLESSRLYGHYFPPWGSSPTAEEFQLSHEGSKFVDSPPLALSRVQWETFDGWKRPELVLPRYGQPLSPTQSRGEPTMVSSDRLDLVQDVTTDCSVVASLCAATAKAQHGFAQIFSSAIFPFDENSQIPVLSPNGKYILKLNFNGCHRKVVIDDRLPSSSTDNVLHVIDRGNPSLLWPALLEKAYLKTRGGYDFPGSNSGTDLWIFTGWIPEQIFLNCGEVLPAHLWRRIYDSFQLGNVLATTGTGRMTAAEEADLGLASEHDYAILDMRQVGNQCLFLVKNPWADRVVWKGKQMSSNVLDVNTSRFESDVWTEDVRNALPDIDQPPPGSFWIDLDSMMQHFFSIYLNWNPGLFKHRQDLHLSWNLSAGQGPASSFSRNPQVTATSQCGGPLWLLLSRHFKDEKHREGVDTSEQPKNSKGEPGFISLYVFERTGHRVFLSDSAVYRGPYVDSPQTLARLDLEPSVAYTIAISQQSLPLSTHHFTLSAFTEEPVHLDHAPEMYKHRSSFPSHWTTSTAGGNAGASSYPMNPQFSVSLRAPADLALLVETPKEDLSVHVKLVWGHGKRVSSVTTRDIVGESGEYRRGCALAEMHGLDAGAYTIVCSTFEAGQTGPFTLTVASTVECVVRSIPAETAGRMVSTLPPVHFAPGLDRVRAPVSARRLTPLRLVARHSSRPPRGGADRPSPQPRSPLKASVELGQGPQTEVLRVSGDGGFSDAPMGVRTTDVDLGPDMRGRGAVWLVVERLGGRGAGPERVDVDALTESALEVGEWRHDDD